MSACVECLRARQRVVHKVYVDGCRGCGLRKLAYMGYEERQQMLDRIQHLNGYDYRVQVVKELREECARIKALSAAMPKERV